MICTAEPYPKPPLIDEPHRVKLANSPPPSPPRQPTPQSPHPHHQQQNSPTRLPHQQQPSPSEPQQQRPAAVHAANSAPVGLGKLIQGPAGPPSSPSSRLSASLAAAAALQNGSAPSDNNPPVKRAEHAGLENGGRKFGSSIRDGMSIEMPPSMRWNGNVSRTGGTSPKTMRHTAHSQNFSHGTSASSRGLPPFPPSPFLKSKTAPPGTLPVMIPGGAPGRHEGAGLDREDSVSSDPPSTSSSPDLSGQGSPGGAVDLTRTRSLSSRPRGDASPLGMHRPRHSLSVSIRRKQAQSLASSPVTSGSFSSMTQSPAVSFLATLADLSLTSEPFPRGEYRAGDQVGDFLLGAEIGAGAFSRVFEAEVIDGPHKHLGQVALKIVTKDQPTDRGCQDVQRFIDHETTVWSRLRHPHVLEMLEIMDTDDAVFVVSERVSGDLLENIRMHGKLPEEVARKLFRQIASALRYLHEEVQVVHRDVKCENILLDCHGDAKLADFGLSTDMTSPRVESPSSAADSPPMLPDLSSREPVFLMGSIHYCAPEQLRQTTHCNAASDMWSLGCVLFAMLTGSMPFSDGYTPRLQMMILNGRWDQAKLDAAGCSPAAKQVVTGLLKPKISERWTADDVWASDWLKGT
ncbi:hypothetical protein HDU88_008539 [Geranomyces variabilis]|nr:hypothetical protein HDU88_008539 [Geranomyces variabilis]